MKKVLVAVLALSSIGIFAQGRRSGQSGIHANYGFIPSHNSTGSGSMIKAGYNRVIGNKGFLGKVEGFYASYKVKYANTEVLPYQKYGLNAQIGYGYEGLYPFLINAYGGAFGGYEVVNKGEKNINISDDLKSFRYGISGTIEAEFVVVRNLSITIDYTQFYDFKSKFSKSNGTIFGGLKYYIN